MNVLISGGAGFIGSRLALRMKEEGMGVKILDNLSPQIHGDDPDSSYTYQLIRDEIEFICGDVRRKEDWKRALKDADIIVHLAAETGTGQSMYDVDKYVSVNVGGTAQLLEYLTKEQHGVKKLILASSRAVYGEGTYWCEEHGTVYPDIRKEADMIRGDFEVKCPMCGKIVRMCLTDEASRLQPASVYGYTKKMQEELCNLIGQSIQLPVVIYRFQNVYGPGQSLKNPYTGILSIFSTQIKNHQDLNIFEDGKESRDFVYIDDVIQAIMLGVQKEAANNQIFNVGSGQKTDVFKIAKLLKRKYNSEVNIKISGNFRLGDIRSNVADLGKIRQYLGYEPSVSVEEGISKFVNWVEGQKIEKNEYEKSINEMKRMGLYKEKGINNERKEL